MSRRPERILIPALLAILAGCSTEVALRDPTIPDPLVPKMPLAVGARYPESFDHFIHQEQVIGKEKWQIDLGQSNKLLFNKLFSAMFREFRVVQGDGEPSSFGVDALIEPSIDAFEFSVPEQSQTDAFAVWIRYRIRIFDGQGTQIANWPISAYGKSQTSTFGGDEALRRAAVLAMRDAAALIIMQMDKTTGISSLAKPNAGSEPDPLVKTTAAEDVNDDAG